MWINLTLLGRVPEDVTLQPAPEKEEHYVPGHGSKLFSPRAESGGEHSSVQRQLLAGFPE